MSASMSTLTGVTKLLVLTPGRPIPAARRLRDRRETDFCGVPNYRYGVLGVYESVIIDRALVGEVGHASWQRSDLEMIAGIVHSGSLRSVNGCGYLGSV